MAGRQEDQQHAVYAVGECGSARRHNSRTRQPADGIQNSDRDDVGSACPRSGREDDAAGPIQYQDVGTNIDCAANTYEGGRYGIELTIDDTSVYDDQGKQSDKPSFRSFRASDSMILKDGQSAQFTAATDKVSGEVTEVDVTLTVVK